MHPRGKRQITVRVPASTSNIGPGFDTLALALNLYTTLHFELAEAAERHIPFLRTEGEIAKALPADKTNLIYRLLSRLWKDREDLLARTRITVESEIPLTGGLGSSGAAAVGTIWAADVLTGKLIDRADILQRAAMFEGHPDNAAASCYGGFIVCSQSDVHKKIVTTKLDWPDAWCLLVVVPQYAVSTEKARALLPAAVPHSDAVSNVQKTALLVAAVAQKDEEALRSALHDRLAEPYRRHLVPELADLKMRLRDTPALGCVLSGAGSSILVPAARRHKKQILSFLKDWAARQASSPQVLDLQVAQNGIEQVEQIN